MWKHFCRCPALVVEQVCSAVGQSSLLQPKSRNETWQHEWQIRKQLLLYCSAWCVRDGSPSEGAQILYVVVHKYYRVFSECPPVPRTAIHLKILYYVYAVLIWVFFQGVCGGCEVPRGGAVLVKGCVSCRPAPTFG